MIVALFAKSFGWSIEYILSLTPSQIAFLQDGLSEIAKCESGEKEKEHEFAVNEQLAAIGLEHRVQRAKKEGRVDKDGKAILTLDDIMAAGRPVEK